MSKFAQIAAIICIFVLSSNAGAAPGKFTPSYHTIKADLTARGLYEKNKSSRPDSTQKDSQINLQEFIKIYGFGYIYSPYFITLESSIGVGLKQERIKQDITRESDEEATSFFHKFHFLPSHPYNLELFASQTNPMSGGRAGDSSSRRKDKFGAIFKYNQNPINSTISLEKQDAKDDFSGDIESILVSLNYSKSDLLVGNNYNYSKTDRSDSSNHYSFYNLHLHKKLTRMSINAHWGNNRLKHDGTDSTTWNKGDEWYGEIIPVLPDKFTSMLYFKKNRKKFDYQSSSDDDQLLHDSHAFLFRLSHRLFSSLTNTLITTFQENESKKNQKALGESNTLNLQINSNYSKKIRPGHLGINFQAGLNNLDNKGFTVASESHPSDAANYKKDELPITFTLRNTNVQTDSTIILIKKYDTHNYQLLAEGVHFQHETVNDVTTVTINDIPAGIDEFTIKATYTHGQTMAYKLQTTSWGYNLELNLLDNLIKPNYSFSTNKQSERGGNYFGELATSTTHNMQCNFSRPPLTGGISRQWHKSVGNDWPANPPLNKTSNKQYEDRFNTNARYQKKINDFSNGSIGLEYENNKQKHQQINNTDDIITNTLNKTSEDRYTATAQFQTNWPHANLTGTIFGNYSLTKSNSEDTSYTLQSNLRWQFGKLDLSLNAAYRNYESITDGETSTTENTSINLNLTRNLF